MDYTPGGMRNAQKDEFPGAAINSNPMTQGTRCHQMAMYSIFEAPLQMMADNPTIYMREQECTDYIAAVPTTFDETQALDGKVGDFVAIARRKGTTWYAGAHDQLGRPPPHHRSVIFRRRELSRYPFPGWNKRR